MSFERRICNIDMTLNECQICGQRGSLKIEEKEIPFATTDGHGQFFGQLMHVMNCLLCIPRVNRNKHIGITYDYSLPLTKAEGEVIWDYLGRSVRWKLSRLLSDGPLNEDFICALKVETRETHYTFEVPFRELCYAVAKCGTNVLKQFGIVGYTRFAEEYEDFNIREFIEIKAFALGLELEMGWISMFYSNKKTTSFEKEIELLLFDM